MKKDRLYLTTTSELLLTNIGKGSRLLTQASFSRADQILMIFYLAIDLEPSIVRHLQDTVKKEPS